MQSSALGYREAGRSSDWKIYKTKVYLSVLKERYRFRGRSVCNMYLNMRILLSKAFKIGEKKMLADSVAGADVYLSALKRDHF